MWRKYPRSVRWRYTSLKIYWWATKCVDGTGVDYYGFGFADRWAKKQYCEYKEAIEDNKQGIAEEKRKISQADSSAERKAIRKSLNAYKKENRKMEKLLPLYENAILNCSNGKRDFDCNVYDYNDDDGEREVDLSTHARENSEDGNTDGSGGEEIIPKVAPRINVPE